MCSPVSIFVCLSTQVSCTHSAVYIIAGTSEPFSIAAASFKITRRAAPHSSLPNSVRQGVSVASISIPKCGVFVQTIRMANFCGSRFRFSRPPCKSACVTAYQQPPMKVYTWKATNQNYTPAAPGHCCDATPPQFSLLHTRRRLLAGGRDAIRRPPQRCPRPCFDPSSEGGREAATRSSKMV